MANMKLPALLALFVLLLARAHAEVDCNLQINPRETKDCCKFPEPKFDAYAQQCPQLQGNAKRPPNPCAFDCIYNQTGVLQNGQLNMNNVRSMLNTILSGNGEFVQAFERAFEKCQPIVEQKSAAFQAQRGEMPMRNNRFGNCSPLPAMYSMCAFQKAFGDCPTAAWTTSAVCERAKEIANNCDQSHGMGRRGGGGGVGGRGPRRTERQTSSGGGAGRMGGKAMGGFQFNAFY